MRELNALLKDKFGEDLDTRRERRGRRPSPERIAEYEELHRFFSEMYTYEVERSPLLAELTASYDPREQKWPVGLRFSEWLSGLRQAIGDQLEETKDLSKDQVDALDHRLMEKGLPSLTEMRSRVWRTIPRILKRGRIRNDEEFYLLKEKAIDMADTTLDEESRKFADHLLFEYEFGPKKKSKRGSRGSAPKRC